MGEVYLARDTRLKRDVAIKVLIEPFAQDPQVRARLEREARVAASLSHPNILAVYEVGKHEDKAYLVMELLDGETLRERLRSGPLPLREAIDYAAQIAQGLAAAHARGVVHRDLKPENLLVARDDRVKILDFGLASVTLIEKTPAPLPSGSTALGVVIGTVGYMSPEQARGEAFDQRSDIFSFGAVLYEMVAGRPAFLKDSTVATLQAILPETPEPIGPPKLWAVLERCLAKRPNARICCCFSSSKTLLMPA